MKQRVLLTVAVAAFAASGYVVYAQACDKEKAASAKAASRPSSYLVSSDGACSAKQRTAMASMKGGQCSAHTTSASVASMEHCAAKGTSASVASMEHCAAKGAKATSFALAGSNGQCSGKGMAKTAEASSHHDCDACSDMAACADQLRQTGTQTQVVPLKNGVMFVYTADSPSRVRAVQSAVAHRSERLSAMTMSGDKAKLCPECKNVRGAIASGKLSRETVNIDGGCLTLMTSNDPAMVGRLRTMAGLTTARNVKS